MPVPRQMTVAQCDETIAAYRQRRTNLNRDLRQNAENLAFVIAQRKELLRQQRQQETTAAAMAALGINPNVVNPAMMGGFGGGNGGQLAIMGAAPAGASQPSAAVPAAPPAGIVGAAPAGASQPFAAIPAAAADVIMGAAPAGASQSSAAIPAAAADFIMGAAPVGASQSSAAIPAVAPPASSVAFVPAMATATMGAVDNGMGLGNMRLMEIAEDIAADYDLEVVE